MAELPPWPEHLAALRSEVSSTIVPRLASTAPSILGFAASFAYDQVWSRPGLSLRDRSMVTIAAITAIRCPDELKLHVLRGLVNGLTKDEIGEIFTQLVPYVGFPVAVSAAVAAADVLDRADMDEPSTDGTRGEIA